MRTLLSLAVCFVLCGPLMADSSAISIRRPCPNCPQPDDQDCHPLKILHPQRPDDDQPILHPYRPEPRLEPLAPEESNVGLIAALALTPLGMVLVTGGTYLLVRNIQERNEN